MNTQHSSFHSKGVRAGYGSMRVKAEDQSASKLAVQISCVSSLTENLEFKSDFYRSK